MAQLRDATTSALIAEGDPLELVLIADELGRTDVLFDGVGEAFDPDAVLEGHRKALAGLEQTAAAAKGDAAKRVAKLVAEKTDELEVDPSAVDAARGELEAARAALEQAG